MNFPLLRRVPSVGYTLQASKWQKCPMLLEIGEMASLITSLGSFWMVQVSGVIQQEEEILDPQFFLEVYGDYIDSLKQGKQLKDPRVRSVFSAVWTVDLNHVYTVPVNESKVLVKVEKPVVQLQSHRFDYSQADGSFRSMVLGQEAIEWGIQFSFPHYFQDAECQVVSVKEEDKFPNLKLFKKVQGWMRENTTPIPFEVEGKKVNVPIRIGKRCLSWINSHPQLIAKNLRVIV